MPRRFVAVTRREGRIGSRRPAPLSGLLILAAACGGIPSTPADRLPALTGQLSARAAEVGTAFDLDLRPGFTDPTNRGLSFAASFAPASTTCLSLQNGHLVGTPDAPGIITTTIVATDAGGATVSQSIPIVVFAAGLPSPVLPAVPFGYSDARAPIPPHYQLANAPGGSALALSNTPAANSTTDAGATLGRVLFYDTRLSANDGVACASCHQRQFGFSDSAQFSSGFLGGRTDRHASGLANARFYQRGRFFWDERAATLEDQALQPIQNSVEMGLTLEQLVLKLQVTGYYEALFAAAFGSPDVTSDRVARAIAQYVRAFVSGGSRFDAAFAGGAPNPTLALFTPQEAQGLNLFNGLGRCAPCHATNAHVSDDIHNTGLDVTVTDPGAGNGRFKAPSLRNVALRPRYMHDGRFTSLEQVVDFYNTGVQANPFLDGRLRAPGGAPLRLGLTLAQRDAIVAYLRMLTDTAMLADPRFADPFPRTP